MKQNQYEMTYLIDPQTSENARKALNDSIDSLIASLSGKATEASESIRKKLAYPIKKQSSAFMRILLVELEGAHVLELSTFMKKADGVMRTTILATQERTRMSRELLEKHRKKTGKNKFEKHDKRTMPEKPAKEVTMQQVEKGIEEALVEEVI